MAYFLSPIEFSEKKWPLGLAVFQTFTYRQPTKYSCFWFYLAFRLAVFQMFTYRQPTKYSAENLYTNLEFKSKKSCDQKNYSKFYVSEYVFMKEKDTWEQLKEAEFIKAIKIEQKRVISMSAILQISEMFSKKYWVFFLRIVSKLEWIIFQWSIAVSLTKSKFFL